MTLTQKYSRVKLAAARNTLEFIWRPPMTLWSLPGGRQIDSVYAKTIWRGRGLRNIDSRVFLAAASSTLEFVWCESHSGVLQRLF
ncbi:hypothetical protein PoB_000941200 [Plakobranchus ocellatus]|uniref:Uncharacterized protein n=1 Tax=Plakobranchus ocellatus TaxID=259542 RepID=A0AAV3YJ47_9GAST|nr:hypothetical protein PoB_000941200 [Plakobranchus ocellatus]